jgi:hypothetical protein
MERIGNDIKRASAKHLNVVAFDLALAFRRIPSRFSSKAFVL